MIVTQNVASHYWNYPIGRIRWAYFKKLQGQEARACGERAIWTFGSISVVTGGSGILIQM